MEVYGQLPRRHKNLSEKSVLFEPVIEARLVVSVT